MSRRRWRSRAIALDDSSEGEEEEQQAPAAALAAVAAPRPSRRTALQLSQSTAGAAAVAADSGSSRSGGNALATLLAGSQQAAGTSGASAEGGSAISGAAAPAAAARAPRRGKPTTAAATSAAGTGRPQQNAQGPAAAVDGVAAEAAGGAGAAAGELWVEKYAPSCEADLVVHKKKVQEVREWLEGQRASLGQPGVSRLLVVTGPSGCGKSIVLSVLARALGFDVSEWHAPSAVQREEGDYAGMQRRSKLDEFNEFVARTKMPHLSLSSRSRSRPGSSSGGTGGGSQAAAAAAAAGAAAGGSSGSAAPASQQEGTGRPGRLQPSLLPTLVIVDDLPHAAGPEQRRQIGEALADLAAGARFPVVVVATETSGKAQQERGLSAAAGTYQGLHKELIAVLEAQRATTVSLNPFTPLNIAKALRGILQRERRALPEADVVALAEQANGDLHNAIGTLQFVCTGAAPAAAAPPAKQKGRGAKRKAPAPAAGAAAEGGQQQSKVAYALRDNTLSLFHALGKLLYNKRIAGSSLGGSGSSEGSQQPQQQPQQQRSISKGLPAGPQQQQQPASTSVQREWMAPSFWQTAAAKAAAPAAQVPLAAWAQRQALEFDPEAVLSAAGLEAGSVAAFLHENVLHFIEDAAIEDAAGCLEQLSAADCMASGRRWGSGDSLMGDEDMASSTLLDAAAASTAARGVCFANAHPAPRRWLPLKAPAVFAVHKGLAANRAELSMHTAAAWAVQGGMCCLQPCGRLAAELLPFARAMAARAPTLALQRLQPARWARWWNGQLYDSQQQQGGGSGGGRRPHGTANGGAGGGQQQREDQAAGEGQQPEQQQEQQQPADDVIEESEDEDDW